MSRPGRISLVITTYNRPDALTAVLRACLDQTDQNCELIVADDGSTEDTAALVATIRAAAPVRVAHVWQPDEGFRAAAIRNKGILAAQGDYVVFLDGDCVPQRTFVAAHRRLAEAGRIVTGSRILLDEPLTRRLLDEGATIQRLPLSFWFAQRRERHINKALPLLGFEAMPLRRWKPTSLRGIKTCNLGVWRDDLEAINGFDETFVGWGHEDADLVARLYNYGVRRTRGYFATEVFHLWHREAPRERERGNYETVQARLRSGQYLVEHGMRPGADLQDTHRS
ncbi:MAG: glycosyltransferase family 2 protein [Burkholderiales bacterium]|nr:glycosyltransferase family 2 protein [Burkholderiales bacterium]